MSSDEQHRGNRPRTLADVRVSSAVALLAFVVVGVGSFGPWVTTVVGSAPGTRGDGWITLAAAVVGGLAIALDRGSGAGIVVAGLAALAAAGAAGYDLVHIERMTTDVTVFGNRLATAGWGVYVAFGGALVALAALASEAARVPRTVVWLVAAIGALAVLIAGPIRGANTSKASTSARAPSTSVSTPSTPAAPTVSHSSTAPAVPTTAQTTPAPVVEKGPSASTSPGDERERHCDPNVLAGPETNCPYAENVFKAVAASYRKSGSLPFAVFASSPETHQLYSLNCDKSAGLVRCVDTTGALVQFSPQSVKRYAGDSRSRQTKGPSVGSTTTSTTATSAS